MKKKSPSNTSKVMSTKYACTAEPERLPRNTLCKERIGTFPRVCTWFFSVTFAITFCVPWASAGEGRRIVRLDGTWQIAEGSMEQVPDSFGHTVPVPGLADMAEPPLEDVGVNEKDERREAFWYRRSFVLEGPLPAVARLKVHKAKFGTRVLLNGQLVGDHLPCFTPGVFDVRKHLKGDGQTNELIIRVGSSRASVPKSIPDGHDFEKVRYLPGIYDSVDLILSGSPCIERVQTVPDLKNKAVRVVATLKHVGKPTDFALCCRVREATGDKVVGEAAAEPVHFEDGQQQDVELTIPIAGCRLWSPEDPFLYRLETTTGADTLPVRFGMRTFRFDPVTKLAILNGKPYPMRGTNVCIFRFFEDPARGDRPWRKEWVRRLHRVFKIMHWNSIRYCIGFPPEQWYDIADELGFLIQDEFPMWYSYHRWPPELKSDVLVEQYTEWMQERWNHPCVVMWDAQNETRGDETGKAIRQVRGLDLSDRPWDNGYGLPARPGDTFEAHPYPFYSPLVKPDLPQDSWERVPSKFRLADFVKFPKAPGTLEFKASAEHNKGNNPIIINEYGWLWLNRDGSPTTLTKTTYDVWLGPEATANQRRELWNRYLAAMTEYWRSHRKVAGILHFCGLAYSRPTGQTSDHFLDIEKLTLEPNFVKYVRDAFAPVGLMIDHWEEEIPAEQGGDLTVAIINDLEVPWEGTVRLHITRDGKTTAENSQWCRVAPAGREVVTVKNALPTNPGAYQLMAEIRLPDGQPVRSWRKVEVLKPGEKRGHH